MMIPHRQSKPSKQQKAKDEQQKKQKSSLMKKILIKNKIVNILSHQPRKLMKLAKMGNIVYKNLQQHTLLPKLTLTNLFPQIQDLNNKNIQHQVKFDQVNKQLTCSMISFQKKFILVDQQDEGKILNIQTQKCYSHIPKEYFSQLSEGHVEKLLTRNKNFSDEKVFDLVDYSDEIEYNINQQVGYKMKLFMDFAQFLQALAGLVDISCKKIQTSRKRSSIVRQIIVQKSINIKILRVKQNNLTASIKMVEQLKKVKHMQKSLMSLIHTKGKVSINDLFQTYCSQHEKIKEFCCRRNLCNFGDIKYYVEKNYQQSFGKALQDYLSEMAKINKEKLVEILKPSKAIYVSTPFDSKNIIAYKVGERAIFSLDQSMDLEQEFELTVKTNIEKQITNIFSFGLEKCTYSTDSLCLSLKQQLNDTELTIFSTLLLHIQKPKQDMLDNFINYTLNRPTQFSLQLNIDDKILNNNQKSEIINRITMVKFVQVVELMSRKLMDLTVRCFSVVNQLLKVLRPLEVAEPEKEEIVSAYLVQLVMISVGFANESLGTFINLREVKETEIQLADKLINQCEQWEEFLDEAETKYHAVWRKLTFSLSDQSLTRTFKSFTKTNRQSSFSQLQEFVKLNYKPSIVDQLNQSKNEDVSEQLISKSQVKLKLLNEIIHAKNEKLNFNFYSLTKTIVSKNLAKVIENETWNPISIMTSKIQTSVGFLLYGQKYLNRLQSQNDSRNFLSKSLLLEKSNFGFKRKSQQVIPPEQDCSFVIEASEKFIQISQRHFKLVGVTEYMLQVLFCININQVIYLLFLYFDKYSVESEKQRETKNDKENLPQKSINPPKISLTLLMEKTIEIISILTGKIKYFVNNLKQLQKKVKSFAKFLLLTYVQLDFFKTIILTITEQHNKRFPQQFIDEKVEKELSQLKKSYLKQTDECMNQIIKKYNSIGYQKIKQSIKKIQINPKKQIKNPSQTTSQVLNYFSKSLQIIKDTIIDQKEFWKFLNCPWIKIYLQKINQQFSQIKKVIMKSNGSNNGRRIEEIEWEDKLNWKAKELKWLLSAIQNERYTEHLKDINILEDQLKRLNQPNQPKK